MKIINIYYLGLIALLSICSSCETVVDIDTDEIKEELVVDAWLNNLNETQSIFLSKSQPYEQNTLPTGLEGAMIEIVRNENQTFTFQEVGNGYYEWTPMTGETIGEEGDIFVLNIELDSKTYQAETYLGRVPMIDSLTQEFEEAAQGDAEGIYTEFYARDVVGEGDAYWIKTFKNGNFLNKPEEINIAFDAGFSPGSSVDGFVFIPPIRSSTNPVSDSDDEDASPWAAGDEFKVEIHSISHDGFFFLRTAQSQITNGSNGIFSEPVINTTGNVKSLSDEDERVLGMFNIAAISSLTITIQ